ncbi:MAG: substrate-binding domain-containing protein, partial [Phycisphaeraceae bacterium]|nr:substrate-binding domain-containing protein [Phycisphaeraceae bacterium]
GCQRPLLIGVDVSHDAVKSAIGVTKISAGAVATIDVGRNDCPGTAAQAVADWLDGEGQTDGLLVGSDRFLPEIAAMLSERDLSVPEDLVIATHYTLGSATGLPFPAIRLEVDPREHARLAVEKMLKLCAGEPIDEDVTEVPVRVTSCDRPVPGYEEVLMPTG